MKRLGDVIQPPELPSFGDYRRRRTPPPLYRRPDPDKEREILEKAIETVKEPLPEPPLTIAEEESLQRDE